jgi:hypothetical protein
MDLDCYYVSHNGQDMGPFSVAEIIAKISTTELLPTDYVYDESKEDWILLLEHEVIAKAIQAKKPKKAPPVITPSSPRLVEEPKESSLSAPGDLQAGSSDEDSKAWYVLKGENKYGPFAYLDIVRMLQEKVIFEFDYVWAGEMESWKRVAEIPDFSSEKIRTLKNQDSRDAVEIFFRRRHSRVAFGGSILVHDNKRVWKGKGITISAGGAGILMDNSMIIPGQTLYLHFKPGDGAPPFNAICEVVNKRYENNIKNQEAPVIYGVKFTSISSEAQKFLSEYTKVESKESA